MKFEVQELSPCKRSLDVTIPLEVVNKEMEQAYKQISLRVSVPGFRKGKVPKNILQKLYSQQARSDVIRKLVPDYYNSAIEEADIYPVDEPHFEEVNLEENTALSFRAQVEVRPKINLCEYKNIKLEKKKIEIADSDVEKAMDEVRNQYAEFIVVEDKQAKTGDLLIIDYKGFVNDQPLDSLVQNDVNINLGSQMIIKDLEDQLIGVKKGEQKDIEVNFPEDYPGKEVAGKKVVFKVVVKEVKEKKLPELDDDFAKDTGEYNSLAELRIGLRDKLTSQREHFQEKKLKEEIMNKLIAEIEVCIPDSLIERRLSAMVERSRRYMVSLGQNRELDEKDIREKYRESVIKDLKESFILTEIAKKEEIKVNQDDLDKEINKIAGQMGQETDALKNEMQRSGYIRNIEATLIEDKTQSFLLQEADIRIVE